MVHAMAETKPGPLSPKKPVKEKIVGIYDDFFKVSLYISLVIILYIFRECYMDGIISSCFTMC